MADVIEIVTLDPVTLVPSTSGVSYKKTTFDNGMIELALNNPAPPVDPLVAAKQQKISQLNDCFNNSLLNGFTSTADGTSRVYPIDPVSMAKLTSASTVINGGKVSSIVIKDFNDNKVTLTAAQYQQMAADGYAFYNNQEQHLWDLEDQAKVATTVSAVNAIVW